MLWWIFLFELVACVKKEKLDKQKIEEIEKLALLSISKSNHDGYFSQLGDIISYVEELTEVPTEKVVEHTHSSNVTNVAREDVENGGVSDSAPKHKRYIVDRVL